MNGPPPTRERRRLQGPAAQSLDGGQPSTSLAILRERPDIAAYLEHFRLRVTVDGLKEASADHWRCRGQEFLDARPRNGDFRGTATREDLQARFDELTQLAAACRAAAEVALLQDDAISADELAGFAVRGTS